jgi:hypothetical protein
VLTGAMLAVASQVTDPGWSSVTLTGLGCAVLVLTHKMATQLFVPLLVVLAVAHGRVDLVLAGALGVLLAWVATGGAYGGMLRAHVAILRFWRTHLENLAAHQVYDSPLFAGVPRPEGVPARRFFEPGARGLWLLARNIVVGNPVVIALPWLLAAAPPSPLVRTLAAWLATTYALVLVTTFVPPLRFLGEGTKYAKFAAFPQAVLAGVAVVDGAAAAAVLLGVLLSAGVLWRLRHVPRFEVLDQELARVVDFVRADPRPRVAAIPCHYCDVLAYLADKRVLWGAHSEGYEKLEEWFPVIRTPVAEVLDKYGIDLLLLDRSYVDPAHLELGPRFRPVLDQKRLLLLERAA